jgi:hypothetical protein
MADRASVASASITHEILQATLVLRFIQMVQGKPRRPHYRCGPGEMGESCVCA